MRTETRPRKWLWAVVLALAACREPAQERAPEPVHKPAREIERELRPGQPMAATLGPGEVHRYRLLSLRQGDLLRVVVEQQGIDVVVDLDDPAGHRVLEADRPINNHGPELVLAVAERAGDYWLVVRGAEKVEPGRYVATIEALRPASPTDRRAAEAYRLFTGVAGKNDDQATALRTQALATWRELGEVALQAEALHSLARGQKDLRAAAELYRQAAVTFHRAGDARWETIERTNLGTSLLDLNETQEAVDQYTRALALAPPDDLWTQAQAHHGLGQAFRYQGELQKARDHYNRALLLWPKEDPQRAYTLHQLGILYLRYLHEESRGADLLRKARNAWGPKDGKWKAATLSQLGWYAYEQGHLDDARRSFEEALALQRKNDDPCGSATVLLRLALVDDTQEAEAHRKEGLQIVNSQPCLKQAPTVYLLAAHLAEKRRDPASARAAYERSETLFADLGDSLGMAESLTGIAHNAGDLQAARMANRRALDILQSVRTTLYSEDLRISFLAGAQEAFDLQIGLLLKLSEGEEAWATAEEARARALRDLLAEAGADVRTDASPALAARERALQGELNVLETKRRAASTPETVQSLRKALAAKVEELESLRGEIRRQSPRYASLTQSQRVTVATIRRDLLDDDTVLLEYRLRAAASTVWAVTRDGFRAVRLPPRREIEQVAGEAASSLQSSEGNPVVLRELSGLILGPVAPFLTHRRLVVVADGALEAVPFAALPLPAPAGDPAEAPLLVDAHEVVSLPSAATLVVQRRLLADRKPAPGWLAVVADDRRLPGARQEAAAIVAPLPKDKVLTATGLDASRKTVMGGALRPFRIVHFATHGELDAEQPLLSALDLADGALRAHEIYDLDLPAELAVLSACETALGKDVPGEGLVSGLPRAFLYAGAARVVVSLWEVDDQSTRDLMVRFYDGLFQRKLPPARALQEAQRELRQAGRSSREWAGFVLLGDWRPLPPFAG